ncbi:MAG: peptide deformylase [Nitrospira sp.]|nr:peptide deformylase [Nitrospira sp.]MCB9711923.1 peptide deformylase [Nitrospiraceae bacterium]MDR4487596.1 peptide deformylase [Nitrospirales bacterium]MCA9465104.1 peptide deformylase [Nitrospira sp.]MCA9475382.1 peptide deformylase [Nitrospira sp.]
MAILPIAKVGNPILRQIAKPVDPHVIGSRRFQEFLDDMFETMVHFEGIGLAAPQVACSEQVVVMECEGTDGIPRTVLINPKIIFYGPTQSTMWEGCLSIDNMRGKVVRPSMVRVQALDRNGATQDIEANGLYAVCIQHEMDHLIGKLFVDRMTDMSTLTQLKEFEAYWQEESATVI